MHAFPKHVNAEKSVKTYCTTVSEPQYFYGHLANSYYSRARSCPPKRALLKQKMGRYPPLIHSCLGVFRSHAASWEIFHSKKCCYAPILLLLLLRCRLLFFPEPAITFPRASGAHPKRGAKLPVFWTPPLPPHPMIGLPPSWWWQAMLGPTPTASKTLKNHRL